MTLRNFNELDEKLQSMRSCYLNLVNRTQMPTIVAQELVKILNKLKQSDISQSHFDKDEMDYLNYLWIQFISFSENATNYFSWILDYLPY